MPETGKSSQASGQIWHARIRAVSQCSAFVMPRHNMSLGLRVLHLGHLVIQVSSKSRPALLGLSSLFTIGNTIMLKRRPPATPAAPLSGPDLFILPPELRNRIFEYVFAGKKFFYKHRASKTRVMTLSGKLERFRRMTTPISIRGVSKQCYTESRAMFFKTVQIDLSKLIDTY